MSEFQFIIDLFMEMRQKNCKFIQFGRVGHIPVLTLTPLRGWWGRCEKNYLRKEEGREGGEKSARSAPAGPGARTRDLPRARRGSPAARQGGC